MLVWQWRTDNSKNFILNVSDSCVDRDINILK
jgi:hypothetical protein